MKNEIIERLKSPIVWMGIISQIMAILVMCYPEFSEPFKIGATAIVEILTLIGILNNPTDKENF